MENGKVVRFLFVLSALFTFMIPGIVMAGNSLLTIQTDGNASNASAGESGATISSSALISVVVTNSLGAAVSNLGSSTGDGTSEIALPNGWTLSTGFNVPPGACLMTPTEFNNDGGGIYTIRVVPFVSNESCTWLEGKYHYVVSIERKGSGESGEREDSGKKPFKGSGLGVLAIK
ncbi:MAG TPA: hypothetical protein VI727_09140 [Candidatus Brocadiaceae bacterium]|nr:hypothetical protein [Candidatus Brocadiaceae bacterium]